jgi:two-component system NtrC family sensor kinase
VAPGSGSEYDGSADGRATPGPRAIVQRLREGSRSVLKLGLRTKFFLYSNAVIVATMSLVALLARAHDRSQAFQAMESRSGRVSEVLASLVTDTLSRAQERPREAARYAARIDRNILEIMAGHGDTIRYLILTDPGGVVTHSSRADLVGRPFARAAPGILKAASELTTTPSGESVLEIRLPLKVRGQLLGGLAVGFSATPIERSLQASPQQLAVVALLMIVANSVLTAVYVEALIRPILSLHQTMKQAGGGDLTVRAPADRGDEVGELGAAFNRMMDELERARDLQTVHQTQLAHAEKMAAVGTLAAGVAHEVNNPLGGVLTCLENMRADPSNEAMREKYLPLIQSGVERIQRTVVNLLDFSRKRPLRLESTSINDSLRRVIELAGYQLRKGRIEVRLSLHPDDPRVMADRSQMEQLFLNLVLNALQAMPEGGTLTLLTEVSDGQVLADVRDTGGGIPPEIRDRIFDPFFTTRGVGEGTGLGLAVSDSIVAAHGGRIEVTSRLGGGSTFHVRLPRLESARTEGA